MRVKTISEQELAADIASVLDDVAGGRVIGITRDGRVVAELRPTSGTPVADTSAQWDDMPFFSRVYAGTGRALTREAVRDIVVDAVLREGGQPLGK